MTDDVTYPTAEVEGFRIGMFVSYDDCGDAWVEAPDRSVGTLIWETGEPVLFGETIAPDPKGRWGTYSVRQPLPMTTEAEAAAYLEALLPELRARWEEWKRLVDQPQSAQATCSSNRIKPMQTHSSDRSG